jgi:methyl-accepting chemotaxis protein
MKTWFLNLRTGTKFLLAFSAALLIAILVGVAGLVNIEAVHREATRVNAITRGAQFSLLKFRTMAAQAEGTLFPGDPGERDLTAEEWKSFSDTAERLRGLAQTVKGSRGPILEATEETLLGGGTPRGKDEGEERKENIDRIASIKGALDDFETHLGDLDRLVEPPKEVEGGGPAPATPLKAKEARNALQNLLKDSSALEAGLDQLVGATVDRMNGARQLGRSLMLGGAAAGTLLALLVGMITTRMVVEPLAQMTAAAHRISEGDLTAEITHVSRDEVGGLADSFRRMQGSLRDLAAEAQRVAAGDLTRSVGGGGQLGEAFNRMVESLSALLREIQEAGTQVSMNSAKILAGLQRNAEASREETSAADRVQGSMETLSQSARGIAASSADVERTAGDAARVASQGTASVGAALEGMFRTRERVNEITQKTLILGEKCRRIGEVLKIIRDVAGEIHMLALNAAIESAASAGEHGKRFTVVAGEVRRLAERTRQSAEEIRSILVEIQEAAEATVAAAQQGAREVEAGSAVAGSARTAMEEVIGRIHKAAEVAREISRATQDQRQSSEQVAVSMRDISRAVRRMAEGSEDSTKAVRELTDLSERFRDLMGTFRTK